ncbi:MAG: hypothetical protein ABW199_05965 [Caulobacterales bacterium]
MGVIDQAKQEVSKAWKLLWAGIGAVLGSPVAVAVAAAFGIAFTCQLIYAPWRFPPLGRLSLAQLGLPSIDFGAAGAIAGEAGSAALRQGAPDAVKDFFAENSDLIPYANAALLALSVAVFIWAARQQMIRYKRRPQAISVYQ